LLDKPDINFGNILRSFSDKSLILPSKTNSAHLVTALLKSLRGGGGGFGGFTQTIAMESSIN
jgi:hypothetical protein